MKPASADDYARAVGKLEEQLDGLPDGARGEILETILVLLAMTNRRQEDVLAAHLRISQHSNRASGSVVRLPVGDLACRPTSPQAITRLSRRQLEVLECIVWGATNRQIADQLEITEGTVKTHVKHVLRKLEVRSRAAAVAIHLSEHGIAGSAPRMSAPADQAG